MHDGRYPFGFNQLVVNSCRCVWRKREDAVKDLNVLQVSTMDETRIGFSAPSWSIDSSFDHLIAQAKEREVRRTFR